jgi:asparagine synthase (glutamine-hydrolysing)
MCGLAGFLEARAGRSEAEKRALARAMADRLGHRGPDDAGAWAEGPCALGHRRLAIIDLSPAGAQPMASHDGRLVMAYNGEIYNFPELRRRLEGEDPELAGAWRGTSDTEVLLEAMARWGVEPAAAAANGMFAFAVWDRRRRRLWLGRDRIGEKPLYYGWSGGAFLFGSELKALEAHPAFAGSVDRGALALYLRHNYVPGPYCIYQGLAKLPPGCLLCVDPDRPGHAPAPRPYWSARQAAEAGQARPLAGPPGELADRLEELLTEAVAMRLVSDVPLGAFLSGGIDSSTVVALMQKVSARPVKTFSIGFAEEGYDEAPFAREVAAHLGTDHTEMYVSPAQALEVVPRLPELFDEPFSDSSQIPTFLVAQLARRHVTVSLSGDAGDELFAGYDRYRWGERIWRAVGPLPYGLRRALAAGLEAAPRRLLSAGLKPVARWLPPEVGRRDPGQMAQRVAGYLKVRRAEAMYRGLVSHWRPADGLTPGAVEPPTPLADSADPPRLRGLIPRMQYLDMVTYLPDDILVKVDRASMGVSLESRIPLLDHRVVELAWRLPLEMKLRQGQGKWLLRQVLYRHVPPELVERPKKGFGVPLDRWLRGPLKEWAADLLSPATLRRQGYFRPQVVERAWREHQEGVRDRHYWLWDLLMFQMWLERRGA